MSTPNIKVTFLGVGGSSAIYRPQRARYGTNTSCVLMQIDGKRPIILDMGTGIAKLANIPCANIFISHFHYDHIEGMPFFKPFFTEGNEFNIYSGDDTKAVLRDFLKHPFMPIGLENFRARINYHNTVHWSFMTDDGVEIETIGLHHPGGGTGYKVKSDGKSVVYLCDNELACEKIVYFCNKADLIIFDAHFTTEEYNSGKFLGWGHSHHRAGVDLAINAGAKRIAFTHHAPLRTDDELDALNNEVRRQFEGACMAAEDMEIIL
jgi:phosphoribosyl 1,2-cyclic phosphodiesterase